MRTTVDIAESQRAKLIELAAERGEKGFSRLVQEAIDLYLSENAAHHANIQSAIATPGTLAEDEAEDMEASVKEIRSRWR